MRGHESAKGIPRLVRNNEDTRITVTETRKEIIKCLPKQKLILTSLLLAFAPIAHAAPVQATDTQAEPYQRVGGIPIFRVEKINATAGLL